MEHKVIVNWKESATIQVEADSLGAAVQVIQEKIEAGTLFEDYDCLIFDADRIDHSEHINTEATYFDVN